MRTRPPDTTRSVSTCLRQDGDKSLAMFRASSIREGAALLRMDMTLKAGRT